MDIVVKGRHTEVAERFRQHVVEKLSKLGKLDGKVISLDVEVSKERNPRLSARSDRVEITCRSRGPVIRAEASADDPYAALDIASAKLESGCVELPIAVACITARVLPYPSRPLRRWRMRTDPLRPRRSRRSRSRPTFTTKSWAPSPRMRRRDRSSSVRRCTRPSPMTLDQALYEMELVGHDFYLFVDAGSPAPSVVYRRRGYDYGVIRLEV